MKEFTYDQYVAAIDNNNHEENRALYDFIDGYTEMLQKINNNYYFTHTLKLTHNYDTLLVAQMTPQALQALVKHPMVKDLFPYWLKNGMAEIMLINWGIKKLTFGDLNDFPKVWLPVYSNERIDFAYQDPDDPDSTTSKN